MSAPLVVPLASRLAADPALVGAKASGLNLLLRHGFPVPPGFCILPSAAGQASINMLRGLPPDFRRDVAMAYHHLGGLVAVRASLPNEDYEGNIHACLGLNGDESTARAVAKCMTDYRMQKTEKAPGGVRAEAVRTDLCPVIVQKLVDAIASGVAYSRNPQTGDDSEIIIEGQWGIDHPDPAAVKTDLFRLRKYPLLLLTSIPAVKVQEQRAGPVGLVRRPLPQQRRQEPCLTVPEILQLGKMIRSVEECVGFVVEVEWALTARGIYLLQLRPAPPLMEDPFYLTPEAAGGEGEKLTLLNNIEVPSEVLSPFAWDFINRATAAFLLPILTRLGQRRLAKIPAVVQVAGRVYFNHTDFFTGCELALHLPKGSLAKLADTQAQKSGLFFTRAKLRLLFLRRFAAVLGYLRRLSPERIQLSLHEMLEECGRLDRVLAENLNHEQINAVLASVDSFLLKHLEFLNGIALESYRYQKLLRRLRRWCGQGSETYGARLVAGLGILESAGSGYGLWDLARAIKAKPDLPSPAEPAAFLAGLEESRAGKEIAAALADFQAKYGHLCPGEFDLAKPRWAENPAWLIGEIEALMRIPEEIGPKEYAEHLVSERSLAMAWIEGRLSTGWRQLFFWRKRSLRRLLNKRMSAYTLMCNAKATMAKLLWRYRQILLVAGGILRERGLLSTVDEVFCLRLEEIQATISGKMTPAEIHVRVTSRATAAELYKTLAPPEVIAGPYRLAGFRSKPPTDGGIKVLRGVGVSPGQGRGYARLVRSAADFKRFMPGEVLVAPNIDTGWGSLFLRARAVVTELGGRLSEAAIMARECGLPAVADAKDAMIFLKDGDLLEVDGGTGNVRLLARGGQT